MDAAKVINYCESVLNDSNGFECHACQIGWYNEKVDPRYRLNYPDDAFAVTVISTPCMFENVYLPWLVLHRDSLRNIADPLNTCMGEFFDVFQKSLPETLNCIILHDYDMFTPRQPRILMNTAGHVSGAAYYYQRSDLSDPARYMDRKLLGVSIHPKYGGWFGFRAFMIFPDVSAGDLQHALTEKLLQCDEDIVNLLSSFTYEWRTSKWRDILPVEQRYSNMQRDYFSRLPTQRNDLVQEWFKNNKL